MYISQLRTIEAELDMSTPAGPSVSRAVYAIQLSLGDQKTFFLVCSYRLYEIIYPYIVLCTEWMLSRKVQIPALAQQMTKLQMSRDAWILQRPLVKHLLLFLCSISTKNLTVTLIVQDAGSMCSRLQHACFVHRGFSHV